MNYYEINADEIYSKNRALRIGYVGENEVVKLYFTSAKDMVDKLGQGGMFSMACENKEYPDGFPLLCEYVGDKLILIINSALLSVLGRGKLQYTYTLGEQKKKSFKYEYSVDSSILSSSTPPEPYESWVEHIDEEVFELGNKVDGFDDRLTSVEGGIVTINGEISDINNDIDEIDTSITSIEGDITSLKADVTSLDTRLDTVENDITSLDTRVDDVEGELNYKLDKRQPITWADLGGTE